MENFSDTSLKGYELQERIGSGGFGAVYKARQTTINREVAIKIILPGLANQPEFIRRFESEAQIIARLEHPFIVPLYDYWRDPNGAYLVMRWLRGGSLKDALKQKGFDLDSVVRLMGQAASALTSAHRNNVIHRDLKPGNVLLDEDCNAYLADFGIAKDVAVIDGDITEPDQLIGSPDYLAPEQARGDPVTPQTDIYSLGVILYEVLTGEHPFPNLSGIERLFKHLNERLPLIDNLDADIQDAVNRVIQKATEKDPAHRYTDVQEMMTEFRQAVAARQKSSESDVVELLTMREQEVLQCMIDGLNNSQIAEKLFITLSTAKWYTKQIYKKLGVRSRVQAIVRARELHLVVQAHDTGKTTVVGGSTSMSHLPEPENPYKGLRAFQPADEQDFFGREKLTQKLIKRLKEKGEYARFLAIIGPSGSGKSSLVKAGLIPALWRGDEIPGSEKWFVVDMLPGSRPLDELEVALTRVAANQAGSLSEHLQRDAYGLLRIAGLILPDDGSELVLIIDQFEEMFTLLEDEEQRVHFLNLLYAAVTDRRSRVRVVVTLRADFYDRPLMYPEFGELIRDRIETVLPLTAQELESAIVNPAKRIGVKFEEGLVATIASEVSYQPGALPLLQYALTELFEQRDKRTLTREAYQKIGGAVGALATRAEELFSELTEAAQETTRQMFLRLVTLGEGVEDTRRRTPRSELTAITSDEDMLADIIDMFVEYRLLSLDHDPATRKPTVEVAHEAILREWERLRIWLDESRSDIRMQRQLAHMAEEWRHAKQERSFLLRGSRLEMFEDWILDTGLTITPQERDFLNASTAQRKRDEAEKHAQEQREARLEQRSQRVLRGLVVVFLTAAVVAGGLALWANNERNRAEDAEYEARRQASIGLASQSRLELENGNQDGAALLALEALQEYPYTSQAESALAEVVEEYVPYTTIFDLARPWLFYVWSPDGKRVAAGGTEPFWQGELDDSILIADADTLEVLSPQPLSLEAGGCEPRTMVWSPSGDRLVSIYMRGEYSTGECYAPPTVWDVESGEQLFQLTGHDDETYVLSVGWSPDGDSILTAGEDGTARLWDAATGEERFAITEHTAAVDDAVWSPDGDRFATASLDGTVRIWDADTGMELLVIAVPTGGMTGVDWSPDGRHLATASEDSVARIWDAENGEILLSLIGHDGALVDVRYSPIGDRIATLSAQDGDARIWDAVSGELLLTLPDLGVEARRVLWSPDGSRINVAGTKNWTTWDVSAQPLNLSGHTAEIVDGEWSPDGTLIATSSLDGTARIWDAASGEELYILEHPNQVWLLDWSPDGTRIVTASNDGTARIWNAFTGEMELAVQLSPEGVILFSASWSPDGSRIINSDMESHATVWDANTGEVITTFGFDDEIQALLDPEEEFCVLYGPSWSPDSSRIATGCVASKVGTGPLIWDADTGELLAAFEDIGGTESSTIRTDWSPDGTRLVTSYSTDARRVWDANTGELLLTFVGHTTAGFTVSWSPDGTRVASGDFNGVVKVWDAETGAEVLNFSAPGNVLNVHWSPDGTHIMAVGWFNTPVIRQVWQSTEDLVDYAKTCCVVRDLTPEEREQFGLQPREE